MGRIKTKWMKTVASRLQEAHPDRFTKDFDHNKEVLNELQVFDEKPIRNKIAGLLARIQRKAKL